MRTHARKPGPGAQPFWQRHAAATQPAASGRRGWQVGIAYAQASRPSAAATPGAALPAMVYQAPHVLADTTQSAALRRRALEIEEAFARVDSQVQEIAARQFDPEFAQWAMTRVSDSLGLNLPARAFHATWSAPLDARGLHATCVLGTFCRLIEREFDRSHAAVSDGDSAAELIRRWGFHAIDITPCADGRLSGVVDYILRVPPAIVAYRKSYAGALFDVEESVQHWETVELRRWRDGVPNSASVPTRYLKVGVYHFSSLDPAHEGCAAHGSDTARAAATLLERLGQFATGVRQTHSSGAAVETLLIGVDTDTDAIRIHVPQADGSATIDRFVDNLTLYRDTRGLDRDRAKEAIRAAVADCAGVSADDAPTEGLRWFCGYLLKNNLSQIDAVLAWHGGSYADPGHTERLIVVGDAVDDVQLRNIAFQAQMETAEEGSVDLDVGIRILRRLQEPRSLAVPVLVHQRYDPRIPGARERARQRALRLQSAIEARYRDLAASGALRVQAIVRNLHDTRPEPVGRENDT